MLAKNLSMSWPIPFEGVYPIINIVLAGKPGLFILKQEKKGE
jgi:hypothetical protein